MDDTGIKASDIDDMDTDSCGEKALNRQRRAWRWTAKFG